MADRGDTHYRVPSLNRWFAVSSILLLGSSIWMVIEDFQRPWKKYQREFRQIEVERPPFGARQHETGIGAPQRPQHRVEQRLRGLVGPAVDGGLGLLVAQACRRAHQREPQQQHDDHRR